MEKLNILMLVAHPDDEMLFGYYDISENNVTVICFTSAYDNIRASEFKTVSQHAKFEGHILPLKDGQKELWKEYTSDEIIEKYIKPEIKEKKYEMIVSHDEKGEYGHKQHIKVHEISKELSKKLKIPFESFRSRYKKLDKIKELKRYNILQIYKSQQYIIKELLHFFDK